MGVKTGTGFYDERRYLGVTPVSVNFTPEVVHLLAISNIIKPTLSDNLIHSVTCLKGKVGV